jgi:hypothetical protein
MPNAWLCLISLLWSYGGGTLSLLSLTLRYAADGRAIQGPTTKDLRRREL